MGKQARLGRLRTKNVKKAKEETRIEETLRTLLPTESPLRKTLPEARRSCQDFPWKRVKWKALGKHSDTAGMT